jgi:regulator of replication initiation timing
MEKQDFLDKLKAVGTSEDEVERRTILSELTDEVTRVYDENSSLSESNKSYIDDNEKLRSANMKLFLQVGENKTVEEVKENITGVKDNTPEPRKFENLFNNEGGLK